jgi:hypothetical protein
MTVEDIDEASNAVVGGFRKWRLRWGRIRGGAYGWWRRGVEGGGWRVEGGGWRVEGGGWRVEVRQEKPADAAAVQSNDHIVGRNDAWCTNQQV